MGSKVHKDIEIKLTFLEAGSPYYYSFYFILEADAVE